MKIFSFYTKACLSENIFEMDRMDARIFFQTLDNTFKIIPFRK